MWQLLKDSQLEEHHLLLADSDAGNLATIVWTESPSSSGPTTHEAHDVLQDSDLEPKPSALGNRPALTGLRATLIACILVFHSNFTTMPGAWAAISAFFVLSGFLITTVLMTEHRKTGGVKLMRFYFRRAVRLGPPLFITVTMLAIYASFVRIQDAADHLWADVAAATFYYADYRSALGHESAFGFLAQCWSLAVEEQFYLIWACLLLLALKYGSRKLAYATVIGGVALSLGDRLWIVLRAPVWNTHVYNRVYYSFDTRADALFVGCLLGLLATGGHLDDWKPWGKRVLAILALVSAGIMIWILFNVGAGSRSVPLWALPVSEVASAVIIGYFLLRPQGLGPRILSIPIVVLLGNMSYAIYLFHWPIYVAISPFTVRWPFWEYQSVRIVIVLVLASASWYLVEQPLMLWRRKALDPSRPAGAMESRTWPQEDLAGVVLFPPGAAHPIPLDLVAHPAEVGLRVQLEPANGSVGDADGYPHFSERPSHSRPMIQTMSAASDRAWHDT